MTRLCAVYGLFSTENLVIRYIGQTTQRLSDRRQQHLAEALRPPGTSRCHRWIRKVIRSGYEIGIKLIEAGCLWDEAEIGWISEYRKLFPELMTNISDGGCGYAGKRSEATRLRMSGPKSPEHTVKLREHMLHLHKSSEFAKSRSDRLRGNTRGRGERNAKAVLSEREVIEIKRKLQDGVSLTVLANTYGMSKAAISKIRTGRTWKHLALSSAST